MGCGRWSTSGRKYGTQVSIRFCLIGNHIFGTKRKHAGSYGVCRTGLIGTVLVPCAHDCFRCRNEIRDDFPHTSVGGWLDTHTLILTVYIHRSYVYLYIYISIYINISQETISNRRISQSICIHHRIYEYIKGHEGNDDWYE